MDGVALDGFFGFVECIVETPNSLKLPILPLRLNQKTIFPIGRWKGVYFSEELKLAIKHGYKVQLLKGYEYDKYYLFTDYIIHFYDININSRGAERFIAKMHLNQLYGYFGRKQELLETINIKTSDLHLYVATRIIKNIIEIDEKTTILLVISNVNPIMLAQINENKFSSIESNQSSVKSNVGIASAVTAYARMTMVPFKMENDVYYTDTDSIFVSNKLDGKFVGKGLGQIKDELDGIGFKEPWYKTIWL